MTLGHLFDGGGGCSKPWFCELLDWKKNVEGEIFLFVTRKRSECEIFRKQKEQWKKKIGYQLTGLFARSYRLKWGLWIWVTISKERPLKCDVIIKGARKMRPPPRPRVLLQMTRWALIGYQLPEMTSVTVTVSTNHCRHSVMISLGGPEINFEFGRIRTELHAGF